MDNDSLLHLIQATVREWKSVESGCDNKSFNRAEELKDLYQSLLREAKRRNLTLSKEQLISQVIYIHSDKKHREKT